MTDHDRLLDAVLDAPDDDTPRLVYADFLDEQGGIENSIRAKFIRSACELARTGEGPHGGRLETLVSGYQARAYQFLLADHPPLAADLEHFPIHVAYDRGLPVLRLQSRCRPDVLSALPPGMTVYVYLDGHDGSDRAFDWLRHVAERRFADRLTGVYHARYDLLREPLEADDYRWLFTANPFRRLSDLSLPDSGLTDEFVSLLARSDRFPLLRTLSLAGNPVTADGMIELADSPVGRGLREMAYFDTPAAGDPAALAAWLRSPALEKLDALRDYELHLRRDAAGRLHVRMQDTGIPF